MFLLREDMHLWKLCFHICVFCDRVTSGLNIRKKSGMRSILFFCSLFLLNLLSDVHAAAEETLNIDAEIAIDRILEFAPLYKESDSIGRSLLDSSGCVEDRGVFLEAFDGFMFSILKRKLEELDTVSELNKQRKGSGVRKVLDYACGVGRQAAIWGVKLNTDPAKEVMVEAMDPGMTKYEKSWHEEILSIFSHFKRKIKFISAAISDKKHISGGYDVITVRDAFHLFPPQDYEGFFANAKKLISENGELLIGAVFIISGLSEGIEIGTLLSMDLIPLALGSGITNFKHTNFVHLLSSASQNGWVFYKVYFAEDMRCLEDQGVEFDCSDIETLQSKIEEFKNKAFTGRIYLSFKQKKHNDDTTGIETTRDNQ